MISSLPKVHRDYSERSVAQSKRRNLEPVRLDCGFRRTRKPPLDASRLLDWIEKFNTLFNRPQIGDCGAVYAVF